MSTSTRPSSGKRELAARAIRDFILARELTPGDPLPSEQVMLATLGVSRTSFREAVRGLEACSILEVRQGDGTFVGHLSMAALREELAFHALVGPDPIESLRQLVAVREALELGLITSLAIGRVLPDAGRLESLLAQMDEEATRGSISKETDRAFHLALYEPLANPIAIRVLTAMWDASLELIPVRHDRTDAMATADRHHSILLAVRASDPRGARIAMQHHFESLRRRLGMSVVSEPG